MFRKGRTVIAIPPGATIQERIKDMGITQKELATRMKLPEKHITKLIGGRTQLTQDIACQLEAVMGISAQYWIGLETIYRAKLKKIAVEG